MKNIYENRKKYASIKGSFLGLLSTLPVTFSYKCQQGKGFAIMANFPWLGFTKYIMENEDTSIIYRRRKNGRKFPSRSIILMTPREMMLKACNLSVSAARGGGRHEVGHAICDMAGYPLPSEEDFNAKVLPHIKLSAQEYRRADLHKWVNLVADIRLERWVGKEYPATIPDFFAVQRWVQKLEAPGRGTSFAGDFLMALRDKGKGWHDEASEVVYQEYSKGAKDLVDRLEPIWSQVYAEGSLKETVHLPLVVGLQLVNEIASLLNQEGLQDNSGSPQEGDDDSEENEEENEEGSQTEGSSDEEEDDSEEDDSEEEDEDQGGGSSDEGDEEDEEEDDEEGQGGGSSDEGEEEEDDDEDQGGGSSDEGDEEDDEDDDQEGGSSEGGDEDDDQEGGSSDEGDDEEEDEDDVEAFFEDDGTKDGESSSDDEDEDDKGSGKEGSLDIEKLEDLLSGEGEALDPSSAFDKNVKKVEDEVGHKIYTSNEVPVVYRKLTLK